MSWLYSQALVEASLPGTSSAGDASVPSSETITPQVYLWPGKTTEALNRSPSGLTSELLTDSRGEAVLMSFLAGFPARTLASQAAAAGSRASDRASGMSSLASFARFDRGSYSWKTPQSSLFEDLTPSSLTWPRSGTMRNGECWERETLPTYIAETVCGSLPRFDLPRKFKWATPTVQDSANNGGPSQFRRNSLPLNAQVGGPLNPEWVEWLMDWPGGWTALEPLATGKLQAWRRRHLRYFNGEE